MGADRAAQEACLTAGGSAVVFPAGRLLDCPAQAHVLYLAEQGYDLPFSAQRALSRNHFIHAMGEKTLVAQCRAGPADAGLGALQLFQAVLHVAVQLQ